MKPPVFDYYAPAGPAEAIALLQEHGDDAKVLAGGQSLVPLLNMRLARPKVIVDLNGLKDLDYIREENGHVHIGAMTRQRAAEKSDLVRRRCPLLTEALRFVAHPQIRNRGTVGGSLAHNDPAAELGAVAACLGAQVVIQGPDGERVAAPEEFFLTYFTVNLMPGEIVTAVRFPALPPGTGHAFTEVSRRHGDFALVAVACTLTLQDGKIDRASLALAGVGGTPFTADTAMLAGRAPSEALFAEVGAAVAAAVDPDSDIHASSEYRKHLAGVLTRRALTTALGRCRA